MPETESNVTLDFLGDLERTHMCGDLRPENVVIREPDSSMLRMSVILPVLESHAM